MRLRPAFVTLFALGLSALLSGLNPAAASTEDEIKKAFETQFPPEKVASVQKTPYAGLYEVVIGEQVFYTDDKACFVMNGSVMDMTTKNNLTQERVNEITAVDFSTLPLQSAIKQVRGDGSRVFAIFSDPNCPYCKRIEKDLTKLDNITLYTFLYPILSQDSMTRAKAVWCSADRATVWNEMMASGVAPRDPGTCATPVEQNLELGKKLHVSGTPTLFFANRRKVVGVQTLAQLQKLLDQSVVR